MEAIPANARSNDSMPPVLVHSLENYVPISLGDMNSVSLMRRVDTKYIMHQDRLPAILLALADCYAVLEIEQRRSMQYSSQYFDTTSFKFFADHHRGKAQRTKIRIRRYVDSGTSFLEIKQKSVKGVTRKHRIRFAPTHMDLSTDALEFIGRTVTLDSGLHPTVCNRFQRITLVDRDRSERVTIDRDLTSHLQWVEFSHRNLVIIEVKQEHLDRHAPIMEVLKATGVRPYRVSKYCLGMTCLCPELKSNRFKPRMIHINKVTSSTPSN